MAQNHTQPGAAMPWTNGTGAAVASGDVVDLGSGGAGMIGVAAGDIADGDQGILFTEEVWELPKDTSVAIAQGAQLYLTAAGLQTAGLITTNVNDGDTTPVPYTPAGKAFAAAATADTTIQIKINA